MFPSRPQEIEDLISDKPQLKDGNRIQYAVSDFNNK